MKRRSTLLLLAAVISILCVAGALTGCRNKQARGSGNAIPADKNGPVTIRVTSLKVTDKIELEYETQTAVEGLAGNVAVTAKAENGKTIKDTFQASGSAVLDCPGKDGILTVTLAFIDEKGKELSNAVLKIRDGLIQLTPDGIPLVVAAMTDDEKAHLITGVSEPVKPGASGGTYAIERLGVPSITVNDGPAGVRYGTAVWYPSVMNLTSSWDSELISRVGNAIGEDSLAIGIDIVLAPGMNIQKNVLGGRNFEYCSEDPLLTAFAATAYLKGMQSAGTGACLKHFVANDQETRRGSASSAVTERALREIYLKPFQLTVAAAAPISIMSSYNPVNSTYASVNKDLLTGILRGEWGYRGTVMSDWGSSGAVEDKVNAQNDLKMPGDAGDAETILDGLANGKVDPEALDICCAHILYTITKSATYRGLDMNTEVDYDNHSALSGEAAADTFVLLKNDGGALPLKKNCSVALFGNGCYQTLYGGEGSGGVNPSRTVSIMKGISNYDGLTVYDEEYNIFQRCPAHSKADMSKDVVVTAAYAELCANDADAAVIVISRSAQEGADNSPTEGDFLLNKREKEMILNVSEAFHAKGKTVTVLINTGSPIEVCSWRDMVDAILFIGYPGEDAGNAIAAVLAGKVNPSGKTVITWPKAYSDTPAYNYFPGNPGKVVYYEDIYVGYRYYSTFGVDVAYPFGYGLSYTEFSYSGFSVTENADGTFTATVTVKNTGSTAGREIAQIYVSKPETTLEQPKLELCGFAKTGLLKPGKSETLTITITADALYSYDTEGSRYIVDRGQYTFFSADSSAKLFEQQSITLNDVRVVYDVENRCVPVTEPEHIVKAEYLVPEDNTDATLIADSADMKKDGKAYVVDLKSLKEVGKVQLTWASIEMPVFVSIAGEDQVFERYDVYMSQGLNILTINLHGANVRYIKAEALSGAKVSDVKVFAATDEDKASGSSLTRNNIALRKKVTVSSTEGGYNAVNAVDGDFESRWGSLPSGEGWLKIDLGEAVHVSGIMLYLEAAWVPYRVEYSVDGKTYTELASIGSGELFVKLYDLDIEARYVRVIREGENWFSIYEAEIYG